MRKLTITCEGVTQADIELALDEATSRIKSGFTSGFDSNDEGNFKFSITDDD